MARYTGPKVKISRRLGVNIFENEKGRKALDKRPYPPGEHGRSRRRQPSEYSMQLQEKQKAKHIYGVLERQFENLYKEATREKGVTGESLLRMLRSEEHTSELKSLMRISYAVFCLKKKRTTNNIKKSKQIIKRN